MSSETSSRRPYWAPRLIAPATPAAGPDSTSRCASASPRSAGTQPPLDCMISSGAPIPSRRSRDRMRSR